MILKNTSFLDWTGLVFILKKVSWIIGSVQEKKSLLRIHTAAS